MNCYLCNDTRKICCPKCDGKGYTYYENCDCYNGKIKCNKCTKECPDRIRYVICGKSGSGKTYLYNLMKHHPHFASLSFIPSYTTRPRRKNEPDDAYKFVTLKEFRKLELEEYCEYNNWYYGAVYSDVCIKTPEGIDKICKLYGFECVKNMILIYLDIDYETRKRRLENRCDDIESERRLKSDELLFREFPENYLSSCAKKYVHITNPYFTIDDIYM